MSQNHLNLKSIFSHVSRVMCRVSVSSSFRSDHIISVVVLNNHTWWSFGILGILGCLFLQILFMNRNRVAPGFLVNGLRNKFTIVVWFVPLG